MSRTTLGLVAVILLQAAFMIYGAFPRTARDGAEENESTLFLLTVRSRKAMEILPQKEKIEKAMQRKEAWTSDPLSVVQLFIPASGRLRVWSLRGEGDEPDTYEAIAISDGFSDDSVRGERVDLILKKIRGTWQPVKAERSWRCWESRGHVDFSTAPCS